MDLPLPEICRQLSALHVLLGLTNVTDEKRDERRKELLGLLTEYDLKWTDWSEFFAAQNIQPAQALPPVDSAKWKKHCQKVCQLHAAMASTDKDGSVAHKMLLVEIAKQKFSWSNDLPAILAAHWNHNKPASASTASAPSTDSPAFDDMFRLTRAVIEDRVVLKPSASIFATLMAFNNHVWTQFAKIPQLGIVAPTPGFGKSTLLEVLARLSPRPWETNHATPASIYRQLREEPRSELFLDALENQNLTDESALCTILDACHDGGYKALTEDRRPIKIKIHCPVCWAIRGATPDVPTSILSRGLQIEMQTGEPRIQKVKGDDPAFFDDLSIVREELQKFAATCTLDFNPEIPVELSSEMRLKDVCLPLLSIADCLGYGAETRAALIELSAMRPPQDDGVQLLIDIKLVFEALEVDRIFKKDLLTEVVRRGHPMWGHYRGLRGKEAVHELRRAEFDALLDRFHIYSKTIWPKGPRGPGVKSEAGYKIEQFEKAWAQHCPDPVTSSQVQKIIALAKP